MVKSYNGRNSNPARRTLTTIFAICFGLFSTALLVWGIFATGVSIGEVNASNQSHKIHYNADAADLIERVCLSGNETHLTDCISEAVNSANENVRAENDLVAQTRMALWALWMLVATVAMSVITAIGVYFVWLTLKATQEMARDTATIGHAQTRAYVELKDVIVSPRRDSNCLEVKFEAHNIGPTPLSEFNYVFLIFMWGNADSGATPPKGYQRENSPQYPNFPRNADAVIASNASYTVSHLVTDFRFTNEEIEILQTSGLSIQVSIAWSFKDVFGVRIDEVQTYTLPSPIKLNQQSRMERFGISSLHSFLSDTS